MIRTLIKSIVRDLTNAVARSELAAENARLRSEAARDNATALTTIADWERQCDDLRAKIRELEAANEKLSAQIQELTYDDRDELRARLEAAERKVVDAANRAERSARVAARQALIEMSRKIRRQTSEREMEEIEAKVFTGWFEPKPKDTAERRSPVDRSAAIASVYAFLVDHWRGCNADRYAREIVDAVLTAQRKVPAEKLTTAEAVAHICRELQSDPGYRIAWVANIAMQFKDRASKHKSSGPDVRTMYVMNWDDLHKLANEAAEGFIELLCKDAPRPTREAPAEKPAAFVPAETDAEPSAELVERMAIEAFNVFNHSVEGYDCGWNHASDARKNGDRASARALYCLIARDHAAAAKRVTMLEAEVSMLRSGSMSEAQEREAIEKALGLDKMAPIAEVLNTIARLSAPCPADGMNAIDVYAAIVAAAQEAPFGHVAEAVVAKARQLFGRAAK